MPGFTVAVGQDGGVAEEAFVEEGAFDEDVGQGVIGVPGKQEAVSLLRGWNQPDAQKVGNGHQGHRKCGTEACRQIEVEFSGGRHG